MTTTDLPAQGRLAGVDFGTVRIGIAISDPLRKLASPYENYTRGGPAADARYFQRLVADEGVVGFVVGLPIHLSGRESEKSQQVRQFAKWLSDTTGCPVRFFDERFTTGGEATGLLEEAQMTSKRRKKRLDMVAAQLLLTGFLESAQQGTTPAALDDSLPGEPDA